MFGRWQSPTCTLCTWGQRCQRLCATDAGCYVRQCGRISPLARGCCRLTLNLSEEGVRILQCTGSRPGCGDGGSGRKGIGEVVQISRKRYVAHMLEEKNKMHYLGCNSDYDCRMKDPTRPKCDIALGRCQECVMNHNHCTPPKRCVPGVTKHLAFSRNHLFLGF